MHSSPRVVCKSLSRTGGPARRNPGHARAPAYHPNGFAILETLAQSLGVKVAVHGHYHDALDSSSRRETQGFKTCGVGLRGITAIDPDGMERVVVPGELDHARGGRSR